MKKLLLNDEDLKVILHISQDEILDFVSKGAPHYYYDDHFYFNYPEIQEWLLDAVELGYIETQYQGLTHYLEGLLHDDLDMFRLREQLREHLETSKGLADSKLMWVYNNLCGPKYNMFYKYMSECFPFVDSNTIYKYYFALLKTMIDSGKYKKDILNKLD